MSDDRNDRLNDLPEHELISALYELADRLGTARGTSFRVELDGVLDYLDTNRAIRARRDR